MFRFVSKQFCLFRLFRYRFETPKQTEIFFCCFTKQTETNAKQILFRFVSVRTEIFFFSFRGHPSQESSKGLFVLFMAKSKTATVFMLSLPSILSYPLWSLLDPCYSRSLGLKVNCLTFYFWIPSSTLLWTPKTFLRCSSGERGGGSPCQLGSWRLEPSWAQATCRTLPRAGWRF